MTTDGMTFGFDGPAVRTVHAIGGRPNHLIFSNLKAWLLGTHHGVSAQHLPVYRVGASPNPTSICSAQRTLLILPVNRTRSRTRAQAAARL